MLLHSTDCLLCGAPLCYEPSATTRACELCGTSQVTTASCKSGHFVCDACHGASGCDLIEQVCARTEATDPSALATELMRSPAIAMHGPEHHFLVPAVLVATYDNVTGRVERRSADVAEVRRRADRVPGGFCGTHGNCGAGVGTGIFWSVATAATPLTTDSWSQSNAMTARCLLRIAEHGGPRCCKRDTYHAISQAVSEVARLEAMAWPIAAEPLCEHSARNKQCRGRRCGFYPG